MKFALFMMGEYVGMTVMAALMTTFFLGRLVAAVRAQPVPRRLGLVEGPAVGRRLRREGDRRSCSST